MTRTTTILLLVFAVSTPSAFGSEKGTLAKQRFSVRVLPKVAVEVLSQDSVGRAVLTSASDQTESSTSSQVELRVKGTSTRAFIMIDLAYFR